jgi:hypothetical protein
MVGGPAQHRSCTRYKVCQGTEDFLTIHERCGWFSFTGIKNIGKEREGKAWPRENGRHQRDGYVRGYEGDIETWKYILSPKQILKQFILPETAMAGAGAVAGLVVCLELKLLSNNAVYIEGLTSFTMVRVQNFCF